MVVYVLTQNSRDDFPANEPPYVYSSREQLEQLNTNQVITWYSPKNIYEYTDGQTLLGSAYPKWAKPGEVNGWGIYLVQIDKPSRELESDWLA